MSAPIDERHRHTAAQLWCLPQFSHREMDAEFAEAIARALAAEREAALEEAAKVAKAHIGSAAKKRGPMSRYDESLREEIRAEERGEDIAAEQIVAAIRRLQGGGGGG